MLCHRRPIADVEPVRGSLLRGLGQTLVPLHLAPARERSMLRPQPTVVGWGLSVASDRARALRDASWVIRAAGKASYLNYRRRREPSGEMSASGGILFLM